MQDRINELKQMQVNLLPQYIEATRVVKDANAVIQQMENLTIVVNELQAALNESEKIEVES